MADKIGTDEYGEILIYQTDDGQTNIEVKIEDDTVWLTQQQLTELYASWQPPQPRSSRALMRI